MDSKLKDSLIGNNIKVIDSVFDSETKRYKDEEAIVKVIDIPNDTTAIVEKINKYSEPICANSDIILEFEFTEKLELDITTNRIRDRRIYLSYNSEVFGKALADAVKKLYLKQPLYYIYRHYGPTYKATFTSTILIGVTDDKYKVNYIIQKDKEKYLSIANDVDTRPQKYAYSIVDSFQYV